MVAFPSEVPVLVDGDGPVSVTLRPHREADIDGIVVASNDPAAQGFLNLPHPYTEENARGFVGMVAERWEQDDSGYHSWAIEAEGRYAGNVSVKRKLADAVEIGYLLHPEARGGGVATRAAALALQHAATVWNPSVFHWRASVGNWASRAVAWKLGFTIDGAHPCSGVNAYGAPQDEWFGHRQVDAPKAPPAPWWVAVPLQHDGVHLSPSADHAWWEQMASGRGLAWDYAGGWLALTSDGVLSQTGTLDFSLAPGEENSATIAVQLLVDHAFAPRDDDRGRNGLGLSRITAAIDSADSASQSVLIEAGFSEWGRSAEPSLISGQRMHFELVRPTSTAV